MTLLNENEYKWERGSDRQLLEYESFRHIRREYEESKSTTARRSPTRDQWYDYLYSNKQENQKGEDGCSYQWSWVHKAEVLKAGMAKWRS